jgi:hypothetical protein
MFVSATLLFLVEPMLAKMVLPLLGGSPAVWNTCLVFFQAVLLAGYLYAYAVTKWLGRRGQIVAHTFLALTAFAVLPLHIPTGWTPPTESNPVFWVLGMLAVTVGLPFFILSGSTPLLQRWFAQSQHSAAKDPYFLYAASNLGSMVGLLGYPLLLEPTLRLGTQSRMWMFGYMAYVALTAACGALIWRARSTEIDEVIAEPSQADAAASWRQRVRWIVLAFVPSSAMMGVTTALTTNVPAIPLFWVLPLALYLLSFVLVFAKHPPISHNWVLRRLPLLLLFSLITFVSGVHLPLPILFPIYLVTLLAIAMECHGELALGRPQVSQLTEFYLWISVGGVLGGIFNSLLAPLIFPTILEFPLILILAAWLRPAIDQKPEDSVAEKKSRRNDLLYPLALGLCTAAFILGLPHLAALPLSVLGPLVITTIGALVMWCLGFGNRPVRFAAGLAALLIAGSLFTGRDGSLRLVKRNFFGVLRVTNSPNGRFRYLIHGGTVHGVQSLDPAKSREPLAYYSTTGPAGDIVRAMQAKSDEHGAKANWAVVGLGAGALACYERPADSLAFYEINPAVKEIALDPRSFTFLAQCAPSAKIVLGDARLELNNAPDGSFDLIVLDAFSGDMIPMHLVTREALAMYLRKLAPGGMIAFHTSNLYLTLGPTIGALANDAGVVAYIDSATVTPKQVDDGIFPSQWIVMARGPADLDALAQNSKWKPIEVNPGARVWTDDYSDLLHIINWH